MGCIAQTPKLKYRALKNADKAKVSTYVTAPGNAYDITNSLPKGYSRNATVDYTNFINKALKENRILKMPDFPVLVNFNGIKIPANTKVYFQKKSKVVLKANKEQNYGIIKIENAENVEVYNANIEGDRRNHLGTKGEWGMGIDVRGSKNVLIKNTYIKDCWGDGIYIGATNNMSENIKVHDFIIDYSRRNGISIINVSGLDISNGLIANTMGTDPQMGIDIEPNKSDDEVKNITISNIKTFNNRYGIAVVLNTFLRSNITKRISISIINHHDIASQYSFRASGKSLTGMYKDIKKYKPIEGEINVVNPLWEDAVVDNFILNEHSGFDFGFLPPIKIQSPEIIQKGKKISMDKITNPNIEKQKSAGKLQIIK